MNKILIMIDKAKHGKEICLKKFFSNKVNFYKRKRKYIELSHNIKPILNHIKFCNANRKKQEEDIPFSHM